MWVRAATQWTAHNGPSIKLGAAKTLKTSPFYRPHLNACFWIRRVLYARHVVHAIDLFKRFSSGEKDYSKREEN